MGYADRDDDEPPAARDGASIVHALLSAAVRLVGLIVLLVGLWVGVKVILEAWALYQDPSRIVRFADDIQRHSNLDGAMGSLAMPPEQTAGESAAGAAPRGGNLRLSYFAAWFVVLLLMFVIGSLAMSAISTGGRLVLYDLGVKRHSRQVLREVQRLRGT